MSAEEALIELMPQILGRAKLVAYHGLPKYTFERHAHNNSAWTTNHSLLNAATLNEYLEVYRARAEWLIRELPNSAAAWRYFEWSLQISMIEKVVRLELSGCAYIASKLRRGFAEHREEFLSSQYIYIGF